ncbi:hypothetical protein [Saccharothrix longispora]|uniref:hypothetical protein n=1 Tax=Saccharothrix longispora TaxID=33920 RepID=UPI0028FD5A8A|nr:hypothetical protein [Saccharothrix longispora]MDU0290877.1 hypothetical protein [Saccharothrix longispora]
MATTARTREDRAVDLVCDQLSDATRALRVVDRPDRGTTDATDAVDALVEVEVDGTSRVWAACVSTITYPSHEVSTERYVRDALPARLDDLARARGHAVRVDCVLADPATDEEARTWSAAYVERVVEAVRNALAIGPGFQALDGEGSIQVFAPAEFPGGGRVVVGTWAGSTADVTERVRRSLVPAVRPELDRLAAARERGTPTLLVLDQADSGDARSAAVPIPTSFTLAPLVETRAAVPDAAVLVRPDGSVQPVHGTIGDRPA